MLLYNHSGTTANAIKLSAADNDPLFIILTLHFVILYS